MNRINYAWIGCVGLCLLTSLAALGQTLTAPPPQMPKQAEDPYRELLRRPQAGPALEKFVEAWRNEGGFAALHSWLGQTSVTEIPALTQSDQIIALSWLHLARNQGALVPPWAKPAEAQNQINHWLDAAMDSHDMSYRLELTDSILQLARQVPAILEPQPKSETQVLSQVFLLFSSDYIKGQFRPHLMLPEKEPGIPSNDDNANTQNQAAQRAQDLQAKYVDLALTHPSWMTVALPILLDQYLLKKETTPGQLEKYLRACLEAQPADLQAVFQHLAAREAELPEIEIRLRLARLIKQVVFHAAIAPDQADEVSLTPLFRLVGVQSNFSPAIWQSPPEAKQPVPFQAECLALFEELCAEGLASKGWSAQVLPYWACYQLHFPQRSAEVLKVVQEHQSKAGKPFRLLLFSSLALEASGMEHHVASVELVDTLLRDDRIALKDPQTLAAAAQLLGLLPQGNGRERKIVSLFASAEELAKPDAGTSAHLQARRAKIFWMLADLLSDRTALPPNVLFVQLEKALSNRTASVPFESKLIKAAQAGDTRVLRQLEQFIEKASGRPVGSDWQINNKLKRGGYHGGVWDLEIRIPWFETALNIGRVTLQDPQGLAVKDGPAAEWLRLWITGLFLPNKTASPKIPFVAGLEPRQFPIDQEEGPEPAASDLSRARDALFLRGLELALRVPAARILAFTHYARLQMSQDPLQTARAQEEALAFLRDNPTDMALAMQGWLGFELERPRPLVQIMACGAVVEEVVSHWPRNRPPSFASVWVEQAAALLVHGQVFVLQRAGGLQAPSQQQVNLNITYEGAKERQQLWLRILDKATQVPALAHGVFDHLARLYVEDDPDRIVACASHFQPIKNPYIFGNRMNRILEWEESSATMKRRLAWGRLGLRLLRLAKGSHTNPENITALWPSHLLKYLDSEPQRIGSEPLPAAPSALLLEQRDDLVRRITEALMSDSELAVEAFASYARQQYRQGANADATLAFLRELMIRDQNRVGTQINEWSDRLQQAGTTFPERIWAAKILDAMDNTSGPSGWRERIASLLAATKEPAVVSVTDPASETGSKAARPRSSLTKGHLYITYELDTDSQTSSGRAGGSQKVLIIAKSNAESARQLMLHWWERIASEPKIDPVDSARLAELVLKGWPESAPAESLDWTLPVLQVLAKHVVEDYGPGFRQPLLVPAAPANVARRDIADSIVAELMRRKCSLHWLLRAHLRLICHKDSALVARIERLRPIFEGAMREQAISYLTDVVKQSGPMFDDNASAPVALYVNGHQQPEPRTQELLDATRALQAITKAKLLPAEMTDPLVSLAQESLSRVVSMAVLNEQGPKSAFSFAGSILPVQGEQAGELLKAWASTAP